MKTNKSLIFKYIRIFIYTAIIVVSSVLVHDSSYTSWIILYSIFLISGIVGVFLEIYKK